MIQNDQKCVDQISWLIGSFSFAYPTNLSPFLLMPTSFLLQPLFVGLFSYRLFGSVLYEVMPCVVK